MPSSEKPASSRGYRSVVNVLVAQLSMALITAGSFLVTPAMLSGLGDAAYGGWLLIMSFISYLRLLDMGTSAGTVKFSAGAIERGDKADLARVINATAAIFLTAAVVAATCAFALTQALPRLYPSIANGQTTAIVLLGGALVVELIGRTFASSLRARSYHFVYDSVEILTFAVFKLGLLLYFARRGLSYTLLGWLTLLETVTRMGLVAVAAFVISPYVRRVNPFRVDRAMVKKLTAMGVAMSIIQIADIVRFQLDAGVIGYFLPESAVNISIYGVGTRLMSIAYASIGVIGGVLIPRFSGMSETGDKKGLVLLLRRASLATDLVAVLVLVNLAVLGPHFLELWLNKPWIPVSGQILRIMLPAYFVALLAEPCAGLLIGRGALRGMTVLTVVEALSNLVLSVLLVKPFGIYGVAIGTAIPMVIARGVFFPLLLKKELGLSLTEYAVMHARPTLLGLAYLALVSGLAFVPLVSYARFFACGLVSVAVFGVLLLLSVPEARAALPKLLAKIARRRTAA